MLTRKHIVIDDRYEHERCVRIDMNATHTKKRNLSIRHLRRVFRTSHAAHQNNVHSNAIMHERFSESQTRTSIKICGTFSCAVALFSECVVYDRHRHQCSHIWFRCKLIMNTIVELSHYYVCIILYARMRACKMRACVFVLVVCRSTTDTVIESSSVQ